MKIVGWDPGKSGALYLIKDGLPVDFIDMPLSAGGKLFNPQEAAKQLWIWNPDAVVVEKVNAGPRMGSSAAYNFGGNSYGPLCLCAGMEIPCHTITPQKWKSYHGLLKKDKDDSRLLALKLFPQLNDVLKRKKDVDRAEAVLMALAWEALR